SIPPTRKKSRRARPAPGATSPMRFPQARDVYCVVQIISIRRSAVIRWPEICQAPWNELATLSRLCPPARAARRSQVPEKWEQAYCARPLALPVHPEMPRTSNNETSDPEQRRCRATPGNDRSVRRASERAGARAGHGLGAGLPCLRSPVAREQAGCRGALRGSEEPGADRYAADAGSDRTGAPN